MDEEKVVVPHKDKFKDIYAWGILQPEIHQRLVEDLDRIASVARIPKKYIYTSCKDICLATEKEWVQSYRNCDAAGLVFTGTAENSMNRMMALAGVFLRNYKDARMYTVQEIAEELKEGNAIDCSVLLIPNFHLGEKQGKGMLDWQASNLLGLLLHRYASSKYTILYITSWTSLSAGYGSALADHIKSNYIEISK